MAEKQLVCPHHGECLQAIEANKKCVDILKARADTFLPRAAFYSILTVFVVLSITSFSLLYNKAEKQDVNADAIKTLMATENRAQDRIVELLTTRVTKLDVLVPAVTKATERNAELLERMDKKLEEIRNILERQKGVMR